MKKKTFDELYRDILAQKVKMDEPLPAEYDPQHLDCLLHPEHYAPVIRVEDGCETCKEAHERACQNSCIFDAIIEGADGKLMIDPQKCTGCEACILACKDHRLAASRDVLPAMKAVREAKGGAYVLMAPAFVGQFGEQVTPGRLRSAFSALGFKGMVEVALFADILTMKEALEFDRHIHTKEDFQLTICCCPVWISMIRKVYKDLMGYVPGSSFSYGSCRAGGQTPASGSGYGICRSVYGKKERGKRTGYCGRSGFCSDFSGGDGHFCGDGN